MANDDAIVTVNSELSKLRSQLLHIFRPDSLMGAFPSVHSFGMSSGIEVFDWFEYLEITISDGLNYLQMEEQAWGKKAHKTLQQLNAN